MGDGGIMNKHIKRMLEYLIYGTGVTMIFTMLVYNLLSVQLMALTWLGFCAAVMAVAILRMQKDIRRKKHGNKN